MQVAVAFPDHTAGPALGNQLPVPLEGGFGPGLEVVQLQKQIRIVNHRTDLVEVLLHGGKHSLRGSKRLFIRHGRQLFVESGDLTGKIGQQFGRQFPLFLQAIEKLVLAELPHLDGVFESLALAAKDRSFRCPGDGHHLQIQVFREPPVESQLLLAEMFSAIESGEVQEAEIHGLLDLVGVVTGQDHL